MTETPGRHAGDTGGKEMNLSRLILIFAVMVFVSAAWGDYQIVWSTIDGGATSSGGQYKVVGAIGQPDAGYSESGNYEILGGYWPGEFLCLINFSELTIFTEYWLESGPDLPADLNSDGIVDVYDLTLLLDKWLCVCPYNWPVM